ncbi:hypothetical protein CK203_064089 [Vitis vinifera]|uniref:Uncharacterized protein n=1 Tax=Vitis vinifera TaxID=29760 RepID=A0A438G3Y9_VITVI|nr:hypothetical protein CK203_064089 [Vitis vinifera]
MQATRLFTCCSSSRFLKLRNRLPIEKLEMVRDLQFGDSTNCINPSDYPFGTLNTCEERLLNLPVREEFRRCFLYYACVTILAPTSRIDGCRNLWHTIHEDGFRNDVNWGQFVVDQLVEVPLLFAWSDELIKERLAAKISEFGSFGHGEQSEIEESSLESMVKQGKAQKHEEPKY